LLGTNSVLHSDFSAQPDIDFQNQQRVILDRLGFSDVGQVLPLFATPSPLSNNSNSAFQQQQQQLQQQQQQHQYTPHGVSNGGGSSSNASNPSVNSNLGPVVPFHLTQRQAQQVSQQLAPSQFSNTNSAMRSRHSSQSSMTGSVTSGIGGSSKWDRWCSGGAEHSSNSSSISNAPVPAFGKRPFQDIDQPFDED
jgi:hypothetical protein